MSIAIKLDEKYSYADYLKWPDDERWEIIEGVPYNMSPENMSPAPNRKHQDVSGKIFGEMYIFLKTNKCKIYSAPFDLRLPEKNINTNEETLTIVQPDIVVICDEKKLDKQGCIGAPDIAVEILSPSTAFKDESKKLKLYEKHGVKEYWIVNPEAEYIMIYHLKGSKFEKPDYYKDDDVIESRVLKGFSLKLSEIWE